MNQAIELVIKKLKEPDSVTQLELRELVETLEEEILNGSGTNFQTVVVAGIVHYASIGDAYLTKLALNEYFTSSGDSPENYQFDMNTL